MTLPVLTHFDPSPTLSDGINIQHYADAPRHQSAHAGTESRPSGPVVATRRKPRRAPGFENVGAVDVASELHNICSKTSRYATKNNRRILLRRARGSTGYFDT